MVASPKYEQLMRFAQAAEKGLIQLEKRDPLHRQTIEGLTAMVERVKHFREHQGFEGLTGDAIKKWLEASLSRYDAEFSGYVSGFSHYVEARRMLKHAAEDAQLLPHALLDSKTAAMRDLAQVVIPVTKNMGLLGFPFNSLATTGEAYVNAVEAQANAAREEQSEKILARITKASFSLASSLHECTEAMKKIPDSKKAQQFPVPPRRHPPLSSKRSSGATCRCPTMIQASTVGTVTLILAAPTNATRSLACIRMVTTKAAESAIASCHRSGSRTRLSQKVNSALVSTP